MTGDQRDQRRTIANFLSCRLESSVLQPDPCQRGQLKKVIAIYPGSFDPLTNGHLDLIQRGSKIFDELIVGILRNPEKDPLFTISERKEVLLRMTKSYANVRVETFDGLLVDYARSKGARAVLRGIRAISD